MARILCDLEKLENMVDLGAQVAKSENVDQMMWRLL